ncbi:MAG TPA: Flp family type IVb pilin [Xanthobacteraceae bacterium]|jgi:pilus assembly protein Flp/PilA|nr:Flp family type IVb pilin [Xanthobacteraceae bacterium]
MPKLDKLPVAGLALRFLRDDGGATAIEYAMIASGIAVAIAATIVTLGSSVQGMYQSVATAMK